MSINIWTDSMQHAALLGKPVLFTNWLIQRDIIPDGWYCYDLRGTHKSPSTRTTLVDHAADYHAGTVLSPIPLKHEGTASRRVNGTFYLLGEEMTLEQFCEEHDLAYPQDNREFVLRPASLDEVGLFYSEEKLDEANYLLFALALRYVSSLENVRNPHSRADFPARFAMDGSQPPTAIRLSSTLARLLPQYDFAEPVIPYRSYDDFRSFRAAAPYDLASLAISPRYAPREADFIADVFREYITEV